MCEEIKEPVHQNSAMPAKYFIDKLMFPFYGSTKDNSYCKYKFSFKIVSQSSKSLLQDSDVAFPAKFWIWHWFLLKEKPISFPFFLKKRGSSSWEHWAQTVKVTLQSFSYFSARIHWFFCIYTVTLSFFSVSSLTGFHRGRSRHLGASETCESPTKHAVQSRKGGKSALFLWLMVHTASDLLSGCTDLILRIWSMMDLFCDMTNYLFSFGILA